MREYLSSVMVISVVSALVSLLIPDGKKSKKYLTLVIGAVMLTVIIEPLSSLHEIADGIDITLPAEDTDAPEGGYLDLIIKNAEAALEREVKSELFSRFKVHEKYADVYLRLDGSDPTDVRVAELTVRLKSYGALADARAVREYFSKKFSCEVKIEYE